MALAEPGVEGDVGWGLGRGPDSFEEGLSRRTVGEEMSSGQPDRGPFIPLGESRRRAGAVGEGGREGGGGRSP